MKRTYTIPLVVSAALCMASLSCALTQQRIQLNGSSMEPGYPDGTVMRIEEVSPTDLSRGDLVYFKLWLTDRFFVKRLIAFPGETVRLAKDGIYVDGSLLVEPYAVIPDDHLDKVFILEDDEYFVLGDNRPNSADSANWGPIYGSDMVGRAVPIE